MPVPLETDAAAHDAASAALFTMMSTRPNLFTAASTSLCRSASDHLGASQVWSGSSKSLRDKVGDKSGPADAVDSTQPIIQRPLLRYCLDICHCDFLPPASPRKPTSRAEASVKSAGALRWPDGGRLRSSGRLAWRLCCRSQPPNTRTPDSLIQAHLQGIFSI